MTRLETKIRRLFAGVSGPYATHRPTLGEAVARTTGPILELGMGENSTASLHAVAEISGRPVFSYDHEASWVERFVNLRSSNHQISCVNSWDSCPIESMQWGVAFVDHAPAGRRVVDIARLADRADVVVVHDTEDSTYGYDSVFHLFRYRYDDRDRRPWTTLLSNRIDVSEWSVKTDDLIPRKKAQTLKTSVLIPCAGPHVALLPELISLLRNQSRRPDEIVAAVSRCPASEVAKIAALDVNVIFSGDQLSAGANRNRAAAVATGDVLIYQDADDVPHPQRVEIIAGIFEKFDVEHLMHFFYYLQDEPSLFSAAVAAEQSRYHGTLPPVAAYHAGLVASVTNGNVALSRALAQSVRWPEYRGRGEDVEFNQSVYAATKRAVVTPLPLITYRRNLSTFR